MATAEISHNGVPEDTRSRSWYVEVAGIYYPPKYLICLANKYVHGYVLGSRDARTGRAQDHLAGLDFKIVENY